MKPAKKKKRKRITSKLKTSKDDVLNYVKAVFGRQME